jgi:hypothetical protein
MSAAEQTALGKAWEAVREDPWGTLAMVGVTALGVGLCATGVGTAVGAGILIGVGASAGIGLATGTFNPRMVAVNGVVGGLSAGVGSAVTTTSWQGAMALGATSGAGETVVGSLLAGQGFPSGTELLVGTGTGGLVSGGAHAFQHLRTPGATAYLDHAPTANGAAQPTIPGTAIEPMWAQAPHKGFLGGWSQPETLQPGTIIDRYGAETGRFFSPAGTSFEARALPAGSGPLNAYEVLSPLEVQGGIVAPAFGQPGLGIQYMSSQPAADLIEAGVIKPVAR